MSIHSYSLEQLQHNVKSQKLFGLYIYTPICGTCQVASKMLTVVESMLPELKIERIDLNFLPDIANHYKIESVPCFLLFENGTLVERIYAFQSVPDLLAKLKR
ncbi:thioredoxin family protein [Peribacillus alkalitolerans]|uniref:thioredoxin family protein n=1 Tax=Peribacillus alkalitolerans TaxID=1550385 RepID=UPI0013D736C1|nr:thioredoxin family protein [Peribacillus alkalitolerans]